jgi:nucleotide-binding universal stress UspA family protein
MFAVHVYEPVQDYVSAFVDDETLNKVATQVKARLDERVAGEEGVTPVLLQGHSGQAITDYAEEIGADCIVIGSHKPELSDFFLGSTATRIVRFAPCSVHVLR